MFSLEVMFGSFCPPILFWSLEQQQKKTKHHPLHSLLIQPHVHFFKSTVWKALVTVAKLQLDHCCLGEGFGEWLVKNLCELLDCPSPKHQMKC